VALVLLALAWRPAVDPIEPPAASRFDPSLIRRGAELAALGDCATCHTMRGDSSFAGGRAIPTPFGTIYSTNITPDPATGIGRWSQVAFARAMREGIDRQGRHLYPAFPYGHFTLLTDEDIAALYAFFMTRPPVRAQARTSDIAFPLRFRPLLAGWKLLFFREGRYREDDRHGAVWNRGAYLAEGIGHCGACHTPRNELGAERANQHFAGGDAEGWRAVAINAASQSPVQWDVGAMEFYLRNGWQASHGVARGPMAPVTEGMATIAEEDVRAMATYVVTGMAGARAAGATVRTGATNSDGARIYAATCADCHESRQPLPFGGVSLSLSSDISDADPINLLHVVLDGLPPTSEAQQPIMPGFATTLSDHQLVALLTYLRGRFAGKSPWPDTAAMIRRRTR
jgi:mono/diheme cytochrome c family protein